jgi:PIN domain nuclease of toxin-antitoxin system
MKILLDTHILLWASATSSQLPAGFATLIDDGRNDVLFSAASLWEIAIKRALGRDRFKVDPRALRANLLDHGYAELPIESEHAMTAGDLPLIHKDPFDRILIAQSLIEGATLLTSDPVVARYPGPIRMA